MKNGGRKNDNEMMNGNERNKGEKVRNWGEVVLRTAEISV